MRENAVRIADIVPPPGGSPLNVIIETFDDVSVLGVLQIRKLALCDVFFVHGLHHLSHWAHAIKIDSRGGLTRVLSSPRFRCIISRRSLRIFS